MTNEEGRRVESIKEEDSAVRILMASPFFNSNYFRPEERNELVKNFCKDYGFKRRVVERR
ncbi:MAG TPA: hypothetical protein DEA27_04700 [Candidatus Moranbacteria bacterium]|nr:hypothetical protein [Candidatus Moranbacteria bacterium]